MRHRCALIALIGLQLSSSHRCAESDDDFGPVQARALIPEAAGCDPGTIELLAALGRAVTLDDMRDPSLGMPLTLAVMAYADVGAEGQRDFRSPLGADITPTDFAAVVSPRDEREGRRVPRYAYASLILPEFIREVTCERQGDEARGMVAFVAPDLTPGAPKTLYEGRIEWLARRTAGTWHIEEFRLPGNGIRVRHADGRWRAEDEARPGQVPRRLTPGQRAVPPSALPRLAAVTEFPAKPLEIAVGGDGQVFFARGIPGFPYLAAALRMRRGADGTAAREPDGSWSRDIVLRVASSLPWEVVGWVVDACAESHLKAHRLHFAALSEPGGVEGVVPCFLPKAPAGVSQLRSLDVRLDAAAEPADDSRVAKAVERRLAMLGGSARVALHVSAGVAAGRVIRALDVVRRVNGAGVTFLGSPEPAADARSGPRPPVPDPQRYAREHPVSQPGFSVTFADGETIGADPLPPPSADRPPR